MKCLPIITLDGPAGVGKSTLAKRLATILGIPYLDTGAMFRTIALRLGPGAETLPEDELRARCNAFRFKLQGGGEGSVLLCNDVPVGREIRTEEVGRLASRLATSTVVRDYLKEAQRSLGESGLVAEGRDMGTVVFPTARFKFFLDARPEVRGMRRFEELQAKGEPADLAQITEMIRQRDDMDRNRAVAPLKPAADAVIVDTSDLDIDGVLKVLTDTVAASSERIVREVRCCPKDAVEGAASGVRDAAFFPHGRGRLHQHGGRGGQGRHQAHRHRARGRGDERPYARPAQGTRPAQGRRAGHGAGRRDHGGEADFGAYPVVPSRAAEFCGRAL